MSPTTSKHLGLALATGSILGLGCPFTERNAQHCYNNDGDAYCAAQYPDGSRPYCESGVGACLSEGSGVHGCLAEPPADECYSPCGGRSTIGENGECVVVEDSSSGSSSGSDTEPSTASSESSTTGPAPCVGNEDCPDAGAPFCEPVSGECVACDGTDDPDGACAGLDPGLPLCVGGACVACTAENPGACTGETPICDDASNSCVPCTEHGQCGEAACNLFTGACLPADAVFHVGGAMSDFATITAAVMSFDAMTEGTIIVHAGGSYDESITVDGGRVLAFLAADGTLPQWIQSDGGTNLPQLTVTDATVLMDGLRLSGNQSTMVPGVRIDAGRTWVDRSHIVQNTGGGIVAENAADLVLRNCFVGQDATSQVSISVDAANAVLLNATALGGFGMSTSALECTGGSAVEIRNGVFATLSTNAEITCPGAMISYTAAETNPGGTGSIAIDSVDETIMAGLFVNFTAGDFHLAAEGITTFADVARWQAGDPTTDIDGDPRPTIDGTPDFAGADLVP